MNPSVRISLPWTTSRAKTVILAAAVSSEWSRGTTKRWSRRLRLGTEYQSPTVWRCSVCVTPAEAIAVVEQKRRDRGEDGEKSGRRRNRRKRAGVAEGLSGIWHAGELLAVDDIIRYRHGACWMGSLRWNRSDFRIVSCWRTEATLRRWRF